MADSDGTPGSGGDAGRLRHWVFLDGNRLVLTALVCLGVFAVTRVSVAAGLLAVGPRGSVSTLFGSGVVAGVFTLITLTLTVNQLISSQVFGQPDSLRSRYEKGVELHDSVSELNPSGRAPVRGSEFVSTTGAALADHADSLREHRTTGDAAAAVDALAKRLGDYADQVESVSSEMQPIQVISTLGGSDYARLRAETAAIAADADEADGPTDDLEAVEALLGHVSVGRQYYKTLALHQQLAQLSRRVIYVSVPTLIVAMYVPLLYRSETATVAEPLLPWVVSGALGVVLCPLALLLTSLLRVATVMRYTVSVAPFVPPNDWPWND